MPDQTFKKIADLMDAMADATAPDNGMPYYVSTPLHNAEHPRVYYGDAFWPSRSYWLIPLQAHEMEVDNG